MQVHIHPPMSRKPSHHPTITTRTAVTKPHQICSRPCIAERCVTDAPSGLFFNVHERNEALPTVHLKATATMSEESFPRPEQENDMPFVGSATTSDPVKEDNFYSPINHAFYAQQPYQSFGLKKSIRLLRVTKDAASEESSFSLTNEIDLENARDTYTAISHCACNPKNTKQRIVNDLPFDAFADLAEAIEDACHYRESKHGNTDILLRAEQICINQSDLKERSHQVGMMYEVYQKARDTAICLRTSESADRTNTAFSWIESFDKSVPAYFFDTDFEIKSWKPYVQTWNSWSPASSANLASPEQFLIEEFTRICLSHGQDLACEQAFWDLCRIQDAPWWGCAWVVQEFGTSQAARFVYGTASIASDLFVRFWTTYYNFILHCKNNVCHHLRDHKDTGTYLATRIANEFLRYGMPATKNHYSHSHRKFQKGQWKS